MRRLLQCILVTALSFGAAPVVALADTAEEPCCDCWGLISPENPTASLNDELTFFVGGGPECGDVSTCSWALDVGTLSETTGSPVIWTAPEELEDCISEEIKVKVELAQKT